MVCAMAESPFPARLMQTFHLGRPDVPADDPQPFFIMNAYLLEQQPGPFQDGSRMRSVEDTPPFSRFPSAYEPASQSVPDADEICQVIQNLIEITCDGEEGYTHAATHVHDRGLREEFIKFARERKSIGSELKSLLLNYGNQIAEDRSSLGAALHRAWINIRTVVTEQDDQAILEEAERGEDAAVAAYKAGSEHPALPAAIDAAIRALMEKVQRAHDRVKSLRDSGLYGRSARH